jgi:hypothetical protein
MFMNPEELPIDFSERPYIVIREVTLACVHCRAGTQPNRSSLKFVSEEGKPLIDEVAQMHLPVFVLIDGVPLTEEPCCSYVPKNYPAADAPPPQWRRLPALHIL